jgi:hypothetical protein
MYWKSFLVAAAIAPSVNAAGATLRFSCSQLVVERLDPYVLIWFLLVTDMRYDDADVETSFWNRLVNPGVMPSPHLHQIVGGNAFNVSMDPSLNLPTTASCTSCTPTEDFSNYWTAVLFFRCVFIIEFHI